MKIWIANESKQNLGGGWSFIRNLEKGMPKHGVTFVPSWQEADIVFVAGATMFSKDTFEAVKSAKKKIVLRVDNIPRNSANRNCGISRLKACADAADLVIYQSEWARNMLLKVIGKSGSVVYNGADTSIFRPPEIAPAPHTFVYSRFGRGETKGFDLAWYYFQSYAEDFPQAELTIVGKFSDEMIQYGFDFFRGEQIKYRGIIQDPEVWASILRKNKILIAPYAADACSNTMIEARHCGCIVETLDVDKLPYPLCGGTPEILKLPLTELTLEAMSTNYYKLLKAL